jgi:hypothetical protein
MVQPVQFIDALTFAGIHAYMGEFGVMMGKFPDGRGWMLADEMDNGLVYDQPLPDRLHLQVYESALENWGHLEFNDPIYFAVDVNIDQVIEILINGNLGDYSLVANPT